MFFFAILLLCLNVVTQEYSCTQENWIMLVRKVSGNQMDDEPCMCTSRNKSMLYVKRQHCNTQIYWYWEMYKSMLYTQRGSIATLVIIGIVKCKHKGHAKYEYYILADEKGRLIIPYNKLDTSWNKRGFQCTHVDQSLDVWHVLQIKPKVGIAALDNKYLESCCKREMNIVSC